MPPAHAQSHGLDTVAFQRNFSERFMADYVPMPLLIGAYRSLQKGRQPHIRQGEEANPRMLMHDGYLTNYTYVYSQFWPSRFVQMDDSDFSATRHRTSKEGNYTYDLSSLSISQLATAAKAYRASYKDEGVEKRRLVLALTAFDTVAVNKPVFFSEIYGKFKGNIGKYVDHLYKHSILCSKSRMDKFVRYPKAEELQKDPGVQFVIGMALYELWIKDVREGRVAEVR
mgnify:CR=1 FL=1